MTTPTSDNQTSNQQPAVTVAPPNVTPVQNGTPMQNNMPAPNVIYVQTESKPPKRPNYLRRCGIIFGILILLLAIIHFATPYNVTKNISRALFEITHWEIFYQIHEESVRSESIDKSVKAQLASENNLNIAKQELDAYLANQDDLDKLMAIEHFRNEIKYANESFRDAQQMLTALKNGKKISSTAVSDATRKLNNVKANIQNRVAEVKRKREIAPRAVQLAETSNLIAKVLYKNLENFEFEVDSLGLTRKSNGDFGILTVNGYYRFMPNGIHPNTEKFFKALNFTRERKDKDNFIICFLLDDNKNMIKFYGSKNNFSAPDLGTECGFNRGNYGTTGVYGGILLSGNQYLVYFNRFSSQRMESCETLCVDMRKQNWTKWSLTVNNIAQYQMERWVKQCNFTVIKPRRTVAYTPVRPPEKHQHIDKYLTQNRASYIPDHEKVGTAPANPEAFFPAAEKEYVEIARAKEAQGNYLEAYSNYQAAWKSGHTNSGYQCARLLITSKIVYTPNGQSVNYKMAEELLLQVLQKAQTNELKSNAYNALGIIYKQGGKGIKANWELSRKYFKLAIEHGEKTYAPKNLQDLENQIKRNQKRSRYY